MSLSYEEQRLQNIKDNEALLLSLGLVTPARAAAKPRPTLIKQPTRTAAQKSQVVFDHAEDSTPVKRKARKSEIVPVTPVNNSTPGTRRSARTTGSIRRIYKELDDGDMTTAGTSPLKVLGSTRDDGCTDDDEDVGGEKHLKQRNAKSLGIRKYNPKKFGAIPGVEVGRWWATRMEASTDSIHAPPVSGISGSAKSGAYSVALSGGYPDDVDFGTAFTYTGCGGRDLSGTAKNPKNLRTAEQTFNQSFEHPMNAALKKSARTKKPVRVIRGYKLPSKYAPVQGYRYDGLYVVEKAWMAKGLTKGLLVCRYAFRRLDGQGKLEARSEEEIAEAEAEQENIVKGEEIQPKAVEIAAPSDAERKRKRGDGVKSTQSPTHDLAETVVDEKEVLIRKRARRFIGVVISTVRRTLVA